MWTSGVGAVTVGLSIVLNVLTIAEKWASLRRGSDLGDAATLPIKPRRRSKRGPKESPGILEQLWRMTVVLLMLFGAVFVALLITDALE